jgi:hypothetical protein
MRCTVLQVRCRSKLYHILSSVDSSGKLCFSTTKPSASVWHGRLGHPSFKNVSLVLRDHDLPFVSNNSATHVCDACMQAKSHQLPFPKSVSISTTPLELMFSDVWGPAPSSAGNHSYYVCFLDDFSKFTWIYLLKYKFEVFEKFHEF